MSNYRWPCRQAGSKTHCPPECIAARWSVGKTCLNKVGVIDTVPKQNTISSYSHTEMHIYIPRPTRSEPQSESAVLTSFLMVSIVNPHRACLWNYDWSSHTPVIICLSHAGASILRHHRAFPSTTRDAASWQEDLSPRIPLFDGHPWVQQGLEPKTSPGVCRPKADPEPGAWKKFLHHAWG